ncbi:hypothetical protein [Pantoea agglomerans]|uniref:hypothetical protein n=1 Tax=Enterobacter agglomerans TaxID=549 RepID=UPI0013B467B8|nr:hypothetical protein [Pantoea agglomerans]
MKEINSEQRYYYAYATHSCGTRPFLGVEMIISNMIDNFKDVTSHSNGSFSFTKDRIGRNAISDTAIVMSYSLLEGFFDEEYDFYVKKEGSKKPGDLSALISTMLHAHGITLKNWRERRKIIDTVKEIRNAVVHSNGRIDGGIYKEKFLKILGIDLFEHTDGYLTLTFDASLWLINYFEAIAREYAGVVFFWNSRPCN